MVSGAPEIRIFQDPGEVAREAADFLVWLSGQARERSGPLRVALSGGSTPEALYKLLAASDLAAQVKWQAVEFYFGDERCVPPDHAESNFRLADLTLFKPLHIDRDSIFRMEGELQDPNQAARNYEALLRRRFGGQAAGWPRFDLLLLGMGDDGHTASLFPGTPALDERERLVVANHAPRGVRDRITFTAPLINAAKIVLFLVCGAGKASAVKSVLEDEGQDPHRFPSRLIRPSQGRLIWFLDGGAASELTLARQQVVSHEE